MTPAPTTPAPSPTIGLINRQSGLFIRPIRVRAPRRVWRAALALVVLVVLALGTSGCAGAERRIVVLVPGVGTDGAVFDSPGASLAEGLRRAGHAVRVLDTHDDVAAELRATGARYPGLDLYAVGLDLGGTALYRAAPEVESLRGVVGIAAPVAFGGASRALRFLFTRAPATWRDAPPRIVRTLLSSGWRSETAAAFSRAPLDLRRWAQLDAGRPVPVPYATDALRARPDLRVLVITAPADGVAPPWACDPVAFGLRWPGLERLWVSRANDFSMEYRHLVLLLHPRAPAEIYPHIEAFLAQ